MASSLKNKLIIAAIAAPVFIAGCSPEYLSNGDTDSLRSGNAHEANTAIQEITAWPENVNNTSTALGI